MTQEEKAKAYDEALEKLRDFYRDYDTVSHLIDVKEELANLFPELKESEDKKIRKALLEYFGEECDTATINGIYCYKIYAWLEKQGTSAKLSEEEQNKFAKGVLSSCALSFINYLDAHKYESKMCVSNGECEDIENAFQNAMWDRLHRYYCKYIEKQATKLKWSDEDEELLQHCCGAVVAADYYTLEDKEEMENWLKSIKERVQPQTKQEWSESDEEELQIAIGLNPSSKGWRNSHESIY